jgi:hypothetical protein
MDKANDGKTRRPRRSPGAIAAVLTEYRASGLTQRAYATQAGISAVSLGRWLRRPAIVGSRAPAGFAAVRLRAEPPVDAAVKIRWPEGMEVELPLSLGESALERWVRALLPPCLR